jgi:hypothetical protein
MKICQLRDKLDVVLIEIESHNSRIKVPEGPHPNVAKHALQIHLRNSPVVHNYDLRPLMASLAASDPSEAQIITAQYFSKAHTATQQDGDQEPRLPWFALERKHQ